MNEVQTVQFENNEAEQEARVERPSATCDSGVRRAVTQFRQAVCITVPTISRPYTRSPHWHPLAWHTAAERINSIVHQKK